MTNFLYIGISATVCFMSAICSLTLLNNTDVG